MLTMLSARRTPITHCHSVLSPAASWSTPRVWLMIAQHSSSAFQHTNHNVHGQVRYLQNALAVTETLVVFKVLSRLPAAHGAPWRCGRATLQRPQRRRLWIHSCSVVVVAILAGLIENTASVTFALPGALLKLLSQVWSDTLLCPSSRQ